MTVKRMGALLLAVALSAALTSCGKPAEDPDSGSGGEISSQEPSVSVIAPIDPEPEPVYPYHNPLTGEGLEEDISGQRPFAVMLNNLSKALPQLGVSQADVIYEIVAEGGITRMLAVFQDIEGVGDLGSVRSARDYYVSLACGHDAIYVHAGGSPQAYDALQGWGMSYIDFVNGPYGDMCWRDPDRRKTAGLEHSLLTSSEKMLDQLPKRIEREHDQDFQVGWSFSKEAPAGDQQHVTWLTVPFSHYKTGHFTYNSDSGLYMVEQHINGKDIPYVDGSTGQEVGFRNVLVLYTDVAQINGDSAGRMKVRTTGNGEGLLLRDGMLYEITWQRDSRNDCLSFLDQSGAPVSLGVGTSYINLVDTSAEVSWG